MDNLEEHIRKNSASFDTELPPEGSEKRFLDRLEEIQGADAGTPSPRRLPVRILLYAVSAAAAIALLLIVGRPSGQEEIFRGVADNPEAIYSHYLAELADVWQTVGPDEEASSLLDMITEEAVPLADQLPEELSRQERAEILREYYGTLLDNAYKIERTIK